MTAIQTSAAPEFGAPFAHRLLPIEDYRVIGDLNTVALVGTDATIDWFCPPRFDHGRAEHEVALSPKVRSSLRGGDAGPRDVVDARWRPSPSWR